LESGRIWCGFGKRKLSSSKVVGLRGKQRDECREGPSEQTMNTTQEGFSHGINYTVLFVNSHRIERMIRNWPFLRGRTLLSTPWESGTVFNYTYLPNMVNVAEAGVTHMNLMLLLN